MLYYLPARNSIFVFFLALTMSVGAQFKPSPVEITSQKVMFQGEVYYVHTVKSGQTLYSICKAYSVTPQEIQQANPGVELNPLSVNQSLRIPVKEGTSGQTDQEFSEGDFLYHTVQPRETPYFLHRKYNIPLEAIYKYNPGSESGIQAGQVIRIPRSLELIRTAKADTVASTSNQVKYEVKPGDTLYRIALIYGVSVADLIAANEELRWGLKAGQFISIPQGGKGDLLTSQAMQDSLMLVGDLNRLTREQCDSVVKNRKQFPPVKVAVLLPFFVKANLISDTISAPMDSLSLQQREIVENAMRGRGASEFYEGFLLAVDSLRKANINMSLFTYDTEGDSNKVRKILNELDIVEPDIIIGPFFQSNVEHVAKFAFERRIPLFPPLLVEDSLNFHNPFIFQTIPSQKTELSQYARYLSQFHKRNLVLFYKPQLKTQDSYNEFKNLLISHIKLRPDFDSLSLTEITIDDSLKFHIDKAFKADKDNYAVVFSEYEPDVITAMTQIHFASREKSVKAFGFPAWQTFANIRIDHLHELETTLYTPFFIDYNAEGVKRFLRVSRSKLGYEPYKTSSKGNGLNFTFLGYDLGMLMIGAQQIYGKNFCDCMPYFNDRLLLSDYHFSRVAASGSFENTALILFRYTNNYQIIKVGTIAE